MGRSARTGSSLATLAHAQWFAVTLYEAVVRMPDRLADARGSSAAPAGPFAAGSPVRYHLPTVPVVLGSTAAALAGLGDPAVRHPLLAATACSAAALGLTGRLVRGVNLRLLDGGPPLPPAERAALLGRWYRLNRVRLALLAGACAGFGRAAARVSAPPAPPGRARRSGGARTPRP